MLPASDLGLFFIISVMYYQHCIIVMKNEKFGVLGLFLTFEWMPGAFSVSRQELALSVLQSLLHAHYYTARTRMCSSFTSHMLFGLCPSTRQADMIPVETAFIPHLAAQLSPYDHVQSAVIRKTVVIMKKNVLFEQVLF